MGSIRATARFAGRLYVVFSILSVFGWMYVAGKIIVSGDAAVTVHNITARPQLDRTTILTSLAGQVLFMLLVLTLYNLFKDVDKKQARLMVVLVCVGVAAEFVNIANRIAPLLLLSGASFLSAFTQPQLESLAMGSLR